MTKTKKNENKVMLEIEEAANHLSNKNIPYDDLCWELAEFELLTEKGKKGYTVEDLRKRVAQIIESSPSDKICRPISKLELYLKNKEEYP